MIQPTFWEWKAGSTSHSIHYIEKGTGPRHILLLHGFAAHSYTWRYLIDDLANAGYHVWSIDLLGSGLSDKPHPAPYGLRLFTTQIDAFMEAKQMTSASIIGNSMGGGLALAMSLFYPKRVESLVLIDALAYPIQFPLYFSAVRFLGNWSKPFFGRTMVKSILKDVMHDDQKITEEQIQAYTWPYQTPGGKEAFIQTLQHFDPQELESLSQRYPDIKVPVLIIWGEQDQWIPLKYYYRLIKTLPHAEHVLIPHCGHIPQEECPQKVLGSILRFYQQYSK